MSTDRATAPVTSLGYGSAAELCRLLDGVSVLLREEPQERWNESADLRLASEALADRLYHRLGLKTTADDERNSCRRDW